MDHVYMVKIKTKRKDAPIESSMHGAFPSFKLASQWLINEGFEIYYDDADSEFFEQDQVSFDKIESDEASSAKIEMFAVHYQP